MSKISIERINGELRTTCETCGVVSIDVVKNTDGGRTAICHDCQTTSELSPEEYFLLKPTFLLCQGRRCFVLCVRGDCCDIDTDLFKEAVYSNMARVEIESPLGQYFLEMCGYPNIKMRRTYVNRFWMQSILLPPIAD